MTNSEGKKVNIFWDVQNSSGTTPRVLFLKSQVTCTVPWLSDTEMTHTLTHSPALSTGAHTPPATPQVSDDEHCQVVPWILGCSKESYLLNRMVSPTWAASCNQQPPSQYIWIPGSLHAPKNPQGLKAAECLKAECVFSPNSHCYFISFPISWPGEGPQEPPGRLQTCWAPWWRAGGGCSGGSWAGWTGGGRAGWGRNIPWGTSAQKTETDPCLRNKKQQRSIN